MEDFFFPNLVNARLNKKLAATPVEVTIYAAWAPGCRKHRELSCKKALGKFIAIEDEI